MKWVKLNEHLPPEGWEDNPPIIRAISTGSATSDVTELTNEKAVYYLGTQRYEIPSFDIEWLDENEPSFNMEDMQQLHTFCDRQQASRSGFTLSTYSFHEYMKEKYNIDM